jgi:aspartyl-tRNA(Asn)/glutamyl-tRNA(Gln) amidotransferase subunit B
MLEKGEVLVKQTLGWDENKQATFPQRTKEGSADYRYFPDPDLPSLKLSEIAEFTHERIVNGLPELPTQKRVRYADFGIKKDDIEMYIRNDVLGGFFEEVIASYTDKSTIALASNYIANDLIKIIRDLETRDTEKEDKMIISVPISVGNFKSIIDMIVSKKISSRSAKDLLALSVLDPRNPEEIAKEKSLFQMTSTSDIETVIARIIEENKSVVEEYKSGKLSALEYLVGQGMKSFKGAVDPNTLREIFLKHIG